MSGKKLTMPYKLPMECATEAEEAIQRALRKEQDYTGIRNPQYLSEVQRHGMTSSWRLDVCRWMFKTAKSIEMEMDTVFRALHFLDQYLSVHSVDRVALQLLGMVCMWTASKMYERKPILLEEMARMCEHKFSRGQMVDVEMELVRVLDFRFSPPNLFTLARDFVHELPFGDDNDRRVNCVASVFHVLERVAEDITILNCSVSSLAKAAVQLVAKSEYDLTVPQVLQALKFIKIKENAYRAAFKIVRGVYFGTSFASPRTLTPQASTSEVLEPLKVLTRSPTAVEQVPLVHDEDVDDKESSSSSTIATNLDDSYLICNETLSPSPSQASPALVRQAASTSCNLGVSMTASSPARSKSDTEPSKKRQRKLTM
ncbi:hypothetical protein PsorP6_009993 [Peronosclerospora sorghi]|uniref:Uncharacterized protein n=1 Tax=Peronosclerospora sorghi TaxID=230839 RepID=A0ACC0VVM2_9STRA|nr:hypothetical protein PsorP6_009993 [Peronosclerospora sorghi]